MKTETQHANSTTAPTLPGDPETKLYVMTAGTAHGGVGKTSVMTDLADWYASKGVLTTKLDLDESVKTRGSFHSFYPDDTIRAPLAGNMGMHAMLDALDLKPRVILVDAAASSSHVTADWFDAVYPEIEALGHRFLSLGVISPDAASLEALLRWLGLLGKRVSCAVVKTPVPPQTPFSNWELSPEEIAAGSNRKLAPKVVEFKESYKPEVLTMPYRDPKLQGLLRNGSVTIARAANGKHAVPELAGTRYRILAQGLHRKITAQFDRVQHLLLP